MLIRSRLVPWDFRMKGVGDRFGLFALMPPLDAKRMLFEQVVRKAAEFPQKGCKLRFVDMKKAGGCCAQSVARVKQLVRLFGSSCIAFCGKCAPA